VLDATQAVEFTRSVAHVPGSFASKKVKGHTYWYYQYRDLAGQNRQIYLGPESPRLLALIEARAERDPGTPLARLARSAIALGNHAMLPKHYKVLQRLADYGFFKAGGVLVGTHAFLTLGNMLGVRWSDGQRTQDVDFAHAGKSMAVALPADLQIDVRAALESLELGLLPIEHADGKTGATYLDPHDPEFQIDFLTPLTRDGTEPFVHPRLGTKLQPLRFMEFLLEDVQQAAVCANAGATIVNVPSPARYAVHKLLVAAERPASRATKAAKDILQAAAVIAQQREEAPDAIEHAFADAHSRGPGWRSRLNHGMVALERAAPELRSAAAALRTAASQQSPAANSTGGDVVGSPTPPFLALTIDTRTAAFEDIGQHIELARLLDEAAEHLAHDPAAAFAFVDTNGNRVGEMERVAEQPTSRDEPGVFQVVIEADANAAERLREMVAELRATPASEPVAEVVPGMP
jgi:hypothetical protein